MASRVIFKDKHGKFVKHADRYKPGVVQKVFVKRRDRYVPVVEKGGLTPEMLADVTTRDEFESMPEAVREIKTFSSKKKYKAWDIAEQIDRSKGMRRKLLKITMEVEGVGRKPKFISFYHEINTNKSRSYHLFKRMNDAIGFENMNFYKTAGGKALSERSGKSVKLKTVKVEEVI